NDASIFGADVGALGDALARAHVERTVIANGDSEQPPERGTIYRRDAVAALMGSDGQVPTGTVDDRLLEDDSSAPFGVRLDHDAVLRAFDGAWTGRAVVLVEASDLVRADAFLSFA